ncbi:MAG TPA: ATP-binding protein, partial [Anaerolineae bacterium]|nr:ATP-binding protein [Anaerolineae bacterium]
PLILETQGLAAALEHYVEKMAEIEDLAMHLELEAGIDNRLSKEAQGALFYIIEEAITNARKHANASDLWIRVFRKGLSVIAEVEDNGKGFDVAAVESNYTERSSLGLLNLYERATLVNGKTVIQSAPGKGTKVIISVPTRE